MDLAKEKVPRADKLGEIREKKQRWNEKVEARFKEKPERFETSFRTPVERLYAPDAIENLDYLRNLSFPGEYPFTRGIQPTMYRGRFWTMRQYAGYATAEESNRRYRYLLAQGQTGLSVAFDLPTQIGYDSDHPRAEGEVGKVGVAISSLEDMEQLFDGIPLDKVSTSMTINATAAVLVALYVAAAKKQGVPSAKVSGTVQNDILKEYIARGTYIYPPGPSLRLVTDLIVYCSQNLPNWNSISISGYHMREAGCTAVQEVAFTIADGIEYVKQVLKRGIDIDSFAPRLSFFFAGQNDLLEEVAKFRAARRLWARIMKERFKAKDPRSMMLRFHTQTAGVALTAQQSENNMVRVAIQALAAVLGGTQSLHTNSMDEALALPSEKAVQIALRTQQIIAQESGVANTIDPLAGSYYMEWLTNEIEEKASEYLEKIEAMGGALRAVELGFFQKEIQESAYRHQRAVEAGETVIVGMNKYTAEEPPPSGLLKVDPRIREERITKLAELKRRRDNRQVALELKTLKTAAKGEENLMPYILSCVENYCTLGEICDVLRSIFGEHPEILTV